MNRTKDSPMTELPAIVPRDQKCRDVLRKCLWKVPCLCPATSINKIDERKEVHVHYLLRTMLK
jgi:hypothetical protein